MADDSIKEYWRDVKEHRKQEKLANSSRRRCYDWMIVGGSTHYAKNRSSFATYRRVRASAMGMPIIGIGTVELEVLREPGSGASHKLILENVVHIPSALCNGFNSSLTNCTQRWPKGGTRGYASKEEGGGPLWYGIPFCGRLPKLALAGNPQGESELSTMEEGAFFSLSVYMTQEEAAVLKSQLQD